METNLCVAGFGGQGVMTLGKFLASATCDSTDKNVTFFPSYGAAMRGGTANCFVVISDDEIGAPVCYNVEDLNVIMLGVYVGYTDAVPEDVIITPKVMKAFRKNSDLMKLFDNRNYEIGKIDPKELEIIF